MKNNLFQSFKVIILGIIIIFSIHYLFAWTSPTDSQTSVKNSIPVPINSTTTPQSKGGSPLASLLNINGTLSSRTLAVAGNMEVNGTLQLTSLAGSSGNPNLYAMSGNSISTYASGGSYSLTVSKSGAGASIGLVSSNLGAISCGSICSDNYAYGSLVTLVATPNENNAFNGWGGACSGSGPTCVVVMDASKNVTANFTAAAVLTVTISGSGGTVNSLGNIINCSPTCAAAFSPGSSVTLTANPSTGTFVGWGGACSGTSRTCSMTINSSQNVTAVFSPLSCGVGVPYNGYCWYKNTIRGGTCGAYCSSIGRICINSTQTCAQDKAAYAAAGVNCSAYYEYNGAAYNSSYPNYNGGACGVRTDTTWSCGTGSITTNSCASSRVYWWPLCTCGDPSNQ